RPPVARGLSRRGRPRDGALPAPASWRRPRCLAGRAREAARPPHGSVPPPTASPPDTSRPPEPSGSGGPRCRPTPASCVLGEVLEGLLEARQEPRGVGAVDDPVVVTER